jgi:adenosylcobinamide-GDP ribazoletransferase
MRMWEELRSAIGGLTLLGRATHGAPADVLAAGLAFYPLAGLASGVVAALAAGAIGGLLPWAAGPLGVLVLGALSGARGWYGVAAALAALGRPGDEAAALARLRSRPGPIALAAAAGLVAMKMLAAAALAPAARAPALLLAPMLGAWAIVVQCYGGAPRRARGRAAQLVGRARFREFGWASMTAIGATLAVGQAIGLALVVVAALTTLALRVAAHRRLGGLSGRLLAATAELVETVVLVGLGGLAALVG